VGCLRGGEYTDGCAVSWSLNANPRATLTSSPGELAILHTSLGLAGNNLTASHLRVTGIDPACGSSMSGFTVQGANDTIEFSSVYDVPRHGILTNTSSSNVTVRGNLIETVGSTCNLDHGIYFQTSGQIVRNVFKDIRCGYAIHLYAHPHDVIVAENTAVGSRVRAGIVIDTDGSNITVANNVFANNATYGINYMACSSGCMVDHNITWGNAQGGVGGTLAGQVTNNRNVDPQFTDAQYHVASTSPAVDTARPDFVSFPDLDGVPSGRGAGPDLGAYER
jgi:Right handed beta helix region